MYGQDAVPNQCKYGIFFERRNMQISDPRVGGASGDLRLQ